MASISRHFTFSKSGQNSSRSKSVSDSNSSDSASSGPIYGARDYKRGSVDTALPATLLESNRRESIVDEYRRGENDDTVFVERTERKYSVPYGPRHYALAARERASIDSSS